ncbi:MAG: MarR family transcriptional regulator [Ignavibacteriae bacterium]|nr:MarR family transcriptional regulator [Ignavibacteriota bacterium]NOG99817.1 MarR family transcriptional regulator [Ignavibacteriota bacterium]
MIPKIDYGEKANLALDTWVKLARAYSSLNKKSLENIRAFGLTQPQFGVIEALGHLGPMKIGVLCAKMLVSGGNMTLVLDNLEKLGLIERVHSKEDRRAIVIQLTKKGDSLFKKIFSNHAVFISELMGVLDEKEQKELGKLLKKLGKGIGA